MESTNTTTNTSTTTTDTSTDTNTNIKEQNTNEQETPAIQFLKQNNVDYAIHQYEYLEKGGM